MGFDKTKIVLSFGAVSDIHIGNSGCGRDTAYFKKALKMLADTAEKNGRAMDAVIGVGDMTDSYGNSEEVKSREIQGVKESYEAVFDPEKVPFVYVLGNHDHDFVRHDGTAGLPLASFIEKMGQAAAHTQYDLPCPDSANGSRHARIGGYHVLFAEPITYGCEGADDSGAKFAPETLLWLDETLARITAEEPERYVFVAAHAMVYGTVYGSELLTKGNYWYSKNILPVLEKYPQVVVFGGHLHFPLNDPRSIMQTDFTALGCGSVNYMAIENGGYEHMLSACITEDRLEFSQGLLVQADAEGNLRIMRLDFYRGDVIGEPLMLPRPTADGAHLKSYAKSRGAAGNNKAPVLSTLAIEKGEMVKAVFASAVDDEFAHHYVLTLLKDGEAVKIYKQLSDFYLHGDPRDMAKSHVIDLGALAGGAYEARLVAVDSWGAESETLIEYFAV